MLESELVLPALIMSDKTVVTVSDSHNGKSKNTRKRIPNGRKKRAAARAEKVGGFGPLLRSLNPYQKALEEPFNFQGAKIPDLVTIPSACFSIIDRRTVATNASGFCSITHGAGSDASKKASLIPNDSNYFAGNTNGSVTCDLTHVEGGGTDFKFDAWSAASGSVPSSYDMVRVVSAAATFSFQGTITSSAGKVSAAFFPKAKLDMLRGSGDITLAQLESMPDSIIMPLNQLKQVTLRYKPADNSVLQYAYTFLTSASLSVVDSPYFPGAFVFMVSGASGGSLQCQVVCQINYEGVPKYNSYMPVFATSCSVSDPLALSLGMNAAANMRVATTSNSIAYANGSPTTSSSASKIVGYNNPVQQKTMFETLMENLPSVLKEGGSALAKNAPLLLAALA